MPFKALAAVSKRWKEEAWLGGSWGTRQASHGAPARPNVLEARAPGGGRTAGSPGLGPRPGGGRRGNCRPRAAQAGPRPVGLGSGGRLRPGQPAGRLLSAGACFWAPRSHGPWWRSSYRGEGERQRQGGTERGACCGTGLHLTGLAWAACLPSLGPNSLTYRRGDPGPFAQRLRLVAGLRSVDRRVCISPQCCIAGCGGAHLASGAQLHHRDPQTPPLRAVSGSWLPAHHGLWSQECPSTLSWIRAQKDSM